MRKSRYQKGSVKRQRGRWIGMWYADGGRKSKVLGLVKNMTMSDAREAVHLIVTEYEAKRDQERVWLFGAFVEDVYVPYYSRKWKRSTREANVNRVTVHWVSAFGERTLVSLKRDELQDLLDVKAKTHSFSVVDHLRWDVKQILDMAVAEGHIVRNPALLLFTPKEAAQPERRVMTIQEVQTMFAVLAQRERLIAKLAVLAGMRPGEIFAMTWGRLTATYADIRQRLYRTVIDSPKTNQSVRKAALSEGVLREIMVWKEFAPDASDNAWVFPSENLKTPVTRDSCWKWGMKKPLTEAGLGWATFQVMRRTHATLMRDLKADPHQVAAQLGHSVDVSLNVYSQSPVETRLAMVNQLEQSLLVN